VFWLIMVLFFAGLAAAPALAFVTGRRKQH
jgi:hypothetical protein